MVSGSTLRILEYLLLRMTSLGLWKASPPDPIPSFCDDLSNGACRDARILFSLVLEVAPSQVNHLP